MPSDVRFAVVRKMLEDHGWTLIRIRGSHHIFQKPGTGIMPIPVHHQKVKASYVRQIEKIFRLENTGEEGSGSAV
jgi:predicted RNA binding protein YcfA (HicA-like mRNA interferase family)